MLRPRFSIVVACYNQRNFVGAAIESALSQRHRRKEIIVVDDASRDGTAELLESFGDAIRLVKFEQNQGPLLARNHGASLASGEYLVFLDGDDVLLPWTLEVYERLIWTQSPKIIIGKRHYFQGEVPDAALVGASDKIDFVSYACWFDKDRGIAFGASNLVIERSAFWEVGGWSPGIFHLDVTDLLMKMGLAGRALAIITPATVRYRIHDANITHSIAGMLNCAYVLLKKEMRGEYPGGISHWLARCACMGGPMAFWIRRAIKAGLYREALSLAFCAGVPIVGATLRRLMVHMRGGSEMQSVNMRREVVENPETWATETPPELSAGRAAH